MAAAKLGPRRTTKSAASKPSKARPLDVSFTARLEESPKPGGWLFHRAELQCHGPASAECEFQFVDFRLTGFVRRQVFSGILPRFDGSAPCLDLSRRFQPAPQGQQGLAVG